MRLERPFLRLPRKFSAEALAAEVRALPASAWMPHPGHYAGNDAVPLITPGGQLTNAFSGPMAPTEHLLKCDYIRELMAELGGVWGRGRLMGLAPGAEVPTHVDVNYYWRTHWRVHIPVITTPDVKFTCGDETVHMAPGECWIFDSFRMHRVHNGGSAKRIHLVIDTVGSEAFWDLIAAAHSDGEAAEPKFFAPGQASGRALAFETVNAPTIMSPWEMRCHIAFLAEHVLPHPRLDEVLRRFDRFVEGWASIWAQKGDSAEGIPAYRALIMSAQADLARLGAGEIKLDNDVPLDRALGELIFSMAVPASAPVAARPQPATPARPELARRAS